MIVPRIVRRVRMFLVMLFMMQVKILVFSLGGVMALCGLMIKIKIKFDRIFERIRRMARLLLKINFR